MHATNIPSQLLYTLCALHPGHPLSGYHKVMDTVEFCCNIHGLKFS